MRQYRRPFLLLNMLFILMTFSGKFAIGFYAVEVFHDASSGLNEYFSAIVVGKLSIGHLHCMCVSSCFGAAILDVTRQNR